MLAPGLMRVQDGSPTQANSSDLSRADVSVTNFLSRSYHSSGFIHYPPIKTKVVPVEPSIDDNNSNHASNSMSYNMTCNYIRPSQAGSNDFGSVSEVSFDSKRPKSSLERRRDARRYGYSTLDILSEPKHIKSKVPTNVKNRTTNMDLIIKKANESPGVGDYDDRDSYQWMVTGAQRFPPNRGPNSSSRPRTTGTLRSSTGTQRSSRWSSVEKSLREQSLTPGPAEYYNNPYETELQKKNKRIQQNAENGIISIREKNKLKSEEQHRSEETCNFYEKPVNSYLNRTGSSTSRPCSVKMKEPIKNGIKSSIEVVIEKESKKPGPDSFQPLQLFYNDDSSFQSLAIDRKGKKKINNNSKNDIKKDDDDDKDDDHGSITELIQIKEPSLKEGPRVSIGRACKTDIELKMMQASKIPGPDEYSRKDESVKRGGKWSTTRSPSEIEILMNRAKEIPGPGEYGASSVTSPDQQRRSLSRKSSSVSNHTQQSSPSSPFTPSSPLSPLHIPSTSSGIGFGGIGQVSGGKFNHSTSKSEIERLCVQAADSPAPGSYSPLNPFKYEIATPRTRFRNKQTASSNASVSHRNRRISSTDSSTSTSDQGIDYSPSNPPPAVATAKVAPMAINRMKAFSKGVQQRRMLEEIKKKDLEVTLSRRVNDGSGDLSVESPVRIF